jgi:arylsulfatase A-like enzyme
MWPFLLAACAAPPADRHPARDPVVQASPPSPQPNLLVLVLDDVGADNLGRTGTGLFASYPSTPNLDALADRGVVFRNAWSHPTCTPSRAAALTGRAPWRTGAGNAIAMPSDWHLAPGTPTAATALADAGYTTAAIGKWHLGEQPADEFVVPDDGWGFDHTAGTIANLGPEGNALTDPYIGYYHYLRHEDGAAAWVWGYATTRTVDDALAWIETAPEPWFGWVAFNAAHAPFNPPPPALTSHEVTLASSDIAVYGAMIEALDAEIGRLLAGLPAEQADRTTVIVQGDNGMPYAILPPPLNTRAKGTTFELGIHVPLFAAGAGVAVGAECDALISITDLAPTLAALGHTELADADGRDFSALLADPGASGPRAYVTSEQFSPNFDPTLPPPAFLLAGHAIRDDRYKLRQTWLPAHPMQDELYDLQDDPGEEDNLLLGPQTREHRETADRLRAALALELVGSPVPQ